MSENNTPKVVLVGTLRQLQNASTELQCAMVIQKAESLSIGDPVSLVPKPAYQGAVVPSLILPSKPYTYDWLEGDVFKADVKVLRRLLNAGVNHIQVDGRLFDVSSLIVANSYQEVQHPSRDLAIALLALVLTMIFMGGSMAATENDGLGLSVMFFTAAIITGFVVCKAIRQYVRLRKETRDA